MPPVLLILLSQAAVVMVPCTYRGDSVELHNRGKQELEVLVGTGMPPVQLLGGGDGGDGGVLVVHGVFTCGLDYVHECWHAKREKIAAGASLKLKLLTAPEKPQACVYTGRAKR